MKFRTMLSVLLSVTALCDLGYSQEIEKTRRPAVAAMAQRTGEHARSVEHGRIGSSKRKAAGQFSGVAETDVASSDAKSGSPSEVKAIASDDDNAVEVKSNRFATFAEVKEVAAVARTASASAKEASSKSAADPRSWFTSHADGAVLSPVTQFEWTRGIGVTSNWLWIGSCQDCVDILDEDQGRSTSRSIQLPVDGRRLYVTLFSFINGDWYWIDYQFFASRNVPVAARMINPVPGSTLATAQIFTWDRGNQVEQMWLRIGTCSGCKDILDENMDLYTYRTVSIPAAGRVVYVQLFSRFGRDWVYNEYQYRQSAPRTSTVRVNVTNKLAYPINISVNGNVIGSVPAYETRGQDVEVSRLSVSFDLNRPTLSGRSLGDPMSGIFSEIANPSGTYNFTVDNKIGTNQYFAPMITNRTAAPVLIEVNGGLQSENRCNCTAGAYSTRVGSGYYRLFSNSNVRLYRSGSNYTGSYRYWGTDASPIFKLVAAESGTVELTLTVAP